MSVSPPAPITQRPTSPLRYGTHTRFTLELEFVTLLASPAYLSHLATTKLLANPPFVAYLRYLLYWTHPPYVQYLLYPGPTLRALEMLQHEDFRKEIIRPEILNRWAEGLVKGSVEGWMEGE